MTRSTMTVSDGVLNFQEVGVERPRRWFARRPGFKPRGPFDSDVAAWDDVLDDHGVPSEGAQVWPEWADG